MYSAPPKGERNDENTRPETEQAETEEQAESEIEHETPTIESPTQTTDANWTGNVPADD